MITKNYQIPNYKLQYDINRIGAKEDVLFLDIETTGFSPQYSSIYLIGCCYYKNNDWYIKQWMCEKRPSIQNDGYEAENNTDCEEKELLSAFLSFVEKFKVLVHFNGNQFDLPFISERCKKYGLTISFTDYIGVDLFKRIFPYRHFLPLSNCKQKTVEEFMKIKREDGYSGGELIKVFHSYCEHPDDNSLKLLLTHNRDDVYGMLQLLPILSYVDLFQEEYHIDRVEVDLNKDVFGKEMKELVIYFSFPVPLPRAISSHGNDCYFTGKEHRGLIKVPIYAEEMKYFYSDYKNYYYLPLEDSAIHKSVASYVEKEFRKQATAATCYTKKSADFLPQWELIFEPFFKREYESKNLFFELTEDFKNNKDAFQKYIRHILEMMTTIH